MKQKTRYTIEMDAQLSSKAWKLLTENFEVTVLKRQHSLDGQELHMSIRLDGEKSVEEQTT